MAIFSQGANPAHQSTSWLQALDPLARAVGNKANEHRAEEQRIAQNTVLQSVLQEIASNPNASFADIAQVFAKGQTQKAGLPAGAAQQYFEHAPKFMEQRAKYEAAQQKQKAPQNDQNAQKWAYEQIGKSESLPQLKNSIDELRRIANEEPQAIGPVVGKVPAFLANPHDNAVRQRVKALGLQVINSHKSLFPRGITQGEFLNLEKKLPSAELSPEAMKEVLDVYDRLNDIAQKKYQALNEATQGGQQFPSNLPFQARKIFDQLDNEAFELAKRANQLIGEGSQTPGNANVGRSQNEKPQVKVRESATGHEVMIPHDEAEEYRNFPGFEVLGSDEDWLESEEGLAARNRARARMKAKK